MRKINNLVLELNSICNNNCIYCYLKTKKEDGDGSSDFFKAQLKQFAEQGAKNIDFTGGEPTLYADLPKLVEYAKHMGFTKRTLVTNGRRLSYEVYCRKLLYNGINNVVMSFDAPNEKISEAITCAKGSFGQTICSINNLKKFNCSVGATIVINSLNYKHISEMISQCISLGVDFINIQHILPYVKDKKISCRRLPSSVIPPYRESGKYLTNALDRFGKQIEIKVHFIPFCCLVGYEKYLSGDALKLDRYVLNFQGFGYNIGEHLEKGSTKTDKCEACKYVDKCVGFFESYAAEFGLNGKM